MNVDLLQDLVKSALAAGADGAEAVGADRRSLGVSVRLDRLEEVEREESRDVGLRVFIGRRQAVVSGSDLSPKAFGRLVERAVDMAKLAPEDPYCGFAPKERLVGAAKDALDLYDASEPSAQALEDRAREAEAAARSVSGVDNSDGASASFSAGQWTLVTSDGFVGTHKASSFSISASVIAGEGAAMERGGEGRTTRHLQDLPSPEMVGLEAGRRAVARLGARKIESRTAPVIFENRLAASLLGPLIGAAAGPAVARGVSFLKDKLGSSVFSSAITIVDEPHRPRGLGSTPFDDEGVETVTDSIVERGVLRTWLLNSASARQLGLETTGHASRGLAGPPGVGPHNLTLLPGHAGRAALMRDAGAGLLVTSMFGPSLNANTGDWSVGVSGVWFEGGEEAFPVTEITVAGNLIELYQRLVPGSDLEIRGSSNAPSILIDGVAIAGL
jgi:PmbA protein